MPTQAEIEAALTAFLNAPADYRVAITAVLEAAELARWQTMDTAPTDETKILANCQPKHVETGEPMSFSYIDVVWLREKKFKDSRWKWRHSLNDSAAEPILWQPLPELPK